MSVELGVPAYPDGSRTCSYTVTVLAALADPETRTDLERPEAATFEVLDAVAEAADAPTTHVVPVRRFVQPGPYGTRSRSVELLDATTLEDGAAALAEHASRIVHAVGWEAGVVAAALRPASIGADGGAGSVVVVEPLGVPGAPEWSLADHAAALVLQSREHRRTALRHGITASVLHVVPPAAPRCPVEAPRESAESSADGRRLVAVVGDGLDPVALECVERVLRGTEDVHVLFAGAAGRDARQRRNASVIRGWPSQCAARVHASSRVGWPLLARADVVVDVSTTRAAPRAALAAMAAGRAVLALGDSPAGDVVMHGRTGLVHRGSDPARHAQAVLGGLGDAGLMQRMGRAGRARWAVEHAPEVRARRLAAIYDTLAA